MRRWPAMVLVCLFGLYFLHLDADFAGWRRWDDWARFTDEGFYSAAAVHHALEQHWMLPGGFNSAAVLPVWPAVLRAWFGVAGTGMAQARALAVVLLGASLLLVWLLVVHATGSRALAATATALVLVSPFEYTFGRMAVLEPMVLFLFLLGLSASTWRTSLMVRAANVGAMAGLMVLTKTTAAVFVPALLLSLWDQSPAGVKNDERFRRTMVPLLVAACVATGIVAAWFALSFGHGAAADVRNIFAINSYHSPWRGLRRAVPSAVLGMRTMGGFFVSLAALALGLSVWPLRRVWTLPLFRACALALAAYVFWIGWHNVGTPRYYAPCPVLLAVLLVLALHEARRWTMLIRTGAVLVAACVCMMAVQTATYVLHPAYAYRDAAVAIAGLMRADRAVPAVLTSQSADDLAMFTGMHAWNIAFPTAEVATLIERDPAGWYATWIPQELPVPAALAAKYTLQEKGRWTVMPSETHQQLVLYRLVPR